MHYYPFHIGDYRKDTARLNFIEHGIYRLLIDEYYLAESPLNPDKSILMRSCRIRTPEEIDAFNFVIDEFFILENDGFHHSGCDKVLNKIYEKSEKARKSAEAMWEKKKANALKKQANAYKIDANALKTDASGMLPNTHNPIPITHNPNILSNDNIIIAQDATAPSPIGKLITNKRNEHFPIYQADLEMWVDTYRATDVIFELKKIRAWLDANPTKRKTKSGMKRFINAWLSKAQDNPRVYTKTIDRVSVISDFIKDPDFNF